MRSKIAEDVGRRLEMTETVSQMAEGGQSQPEIGRLASAKPPTSGGGQTPPEPSAPIAEALKGSVCQMPRDPDFVWVRRPLDDGGQHFQMRLEMTLTDAGGKDLGTLVLLKNGGCSGGSHYTLKRVEHLRRNVVATMEKILKGR